MGMAASQARLLTLTARIHDVEYSAQAIENAKVQLSTQSDQVYNEYLEALDATTLTIKDMDGNKITATFNNLCGINAVDSGNSYSLKDSSGRVIVSEEVADAYEQYRAQLPEGVEADATANYATALALAMGDNAANVANVNYVAIEDGVSANHQDDSKLTSYEKSMNDILKKYGVSDYDELLNKDGVSDEDIEEYEQLENTRRTYLYNKYLEEIAAAADYEIDEDGIDEDTKEKFLKYLRIFKEMEQCGYVCITSYDDGNNNSDAASNNEWLTNMVECGKITIDIVTMNSKTGEIEYNTTSPSSDTYVDYTTTTDIDKTALAKAEAEYEYETNQINKKDEKYDLELSKLETERTALTTEYDSVKKVIEDNIERTFGIFS